MRAPNILLMSVLIATPSLLAAGQDQTSTAPTAMPGMTAQHAAVQGINIKYADPKPCSNGWHATLDAVGNPVNSPGAETTTKTPQPPVGMSAGIPAVPANPNPTVIIPAPKPEPLNLRNIYFETFFYMIGADNLWAEQAEKAGKHAEAADLRTNHQRTAGLNDAEGEVLQEIAHDCNCAVNKLDEKVNLLSEKFRAQRVPGTTITIPAELIQMHEEREKIVGDHIDQLRVAMGDTSFRKLETYVLSMYPAPKNIGATKPASTTTTATQPKENR